jgi:hypothetical protein
MEVEEEAWAEEMQEEEEVEVEEVEDVAGRQLGGEVYHRSGTS